MLVALYRYYYYQHRYEHELEIANKAMQVTGRSLAMPENWKNITEGNLGEAAMVSMGLLRFYLLSLKGAGYLSLRLNLIDEGIDIFKKLTALDPNDRLGVKLLLDMAQEKSNIAVDENVVSIHGYSQFSAATK